MRLSSIRYCNSEVSLFDSVCLPFVDYLRLSKYLVCVPVQDPARLIYASTDLFLSRFSVKKTYLTFIYLNCSHEPKTLNLFLERNVCMCASERARKCVFDYNILASVYIQLVYFTEMLSYTL